MGEEINRLILPLDPKGYDFHTMTFACYEDALKTFLLHFWNLILVKGKIAIFDRSWYSRAIVKHFRKGKSKEKLEKCLEKINCFERQLSDDGYLILKFFLHISEKEQECRFREIKKNSIPLILYEYEKKNEKELDFIHEYNEYLPIIEKVLEKTDMPYAPWTIVGANDRNFATLKIITTAIQVIETYIENMTRTLGQQTIKYLHREILKLPELSASVLEKLICPKLSYLRNTKKPKSFTSKNLKTSSTSFSRKSAPWL